MTRKTRVLVIASVLVSSILIEGPLFAEGEGKKIVMLSDSPNFELLLQRVTEDPLINVVHNLSMINALALELPSDRSVQEGLAYLQNLMSGLSVEGVFDDLVFSVLPITPALPEEVPLQETYDWGLVHSHVDVAHQGWPNVRGQGVKVAIVDTGIACGHPDLPLPIDGVNALPGGVSYCDDHGHGTHVAGIIAARKNPPWIMGPGIIGAAPQASLVAVKVLDYMGKGYLSNLLYGLQWLWIYNNLNQNKIRLVNMSLGFPVGSLPLKSAIEKLFYDHNTLMVAAAGNSCPQSGGQEEGGGDEGQGVCNAPETTTIMYPAAYSVVLAVTATDSWDRITYYSLKGPEVDVTAPGGVLNDKRILSTYYLAPWYGFASGTSQAAAHVTGTLALKLQQQPTLSWNDVQQLLACTATKLKNPSYPATEQGAGLIDAQSLLDTTLPQCSPQ